MSALRRQRIPHPSVSCDLRNIIPSVHWTMLISFSMSTFKASVHTYLRMKTQCLEDECLHLVAKEGSATQTWVWHTEVLFLSVLHWMGLSECKSDMDKHITGLNTVQGWGGNITVVACTVPMMPWCGSGSEWLHWTVLWVSAEQRQRDWNHSIRWSWCPIWGICVTFQLYMIRRQIRAQTHYTLIRDEWVTLRHTALMFNK